MLGPEANQVVLEFSKHYFLPIFFVIDSTDRNRLPVVAEILEDMARHPNLVNRRIPFNIICNKSDQKDVNNNFVDEMEIRKFI